MPPSLFLLHDEHPLEVEIVFFLQDVEERRISPAVNSYLLELIAEVILDGLLDELVPFVQNVIFAFEDKAVDDEVFLLEQV